jgi:hypothetical protein
MKYIIFDYLQLVVTAAAASGYFFPFASCKALQASIFLPVDK